MAKPIRANAPLKTAGGELRLHRSRDRPPQLRRAQPGHLTPAGVATFLGALAATANVRLAAQSVGVAASSVHARRRRDARFAEAWDAALQLGCDRLELAMMTRALEATGAAPVWEGLGTAPGETLAFPGPAVAPLDIDGALRLLAHHRRQTRRKQEPHWRKRPTMDEMRASILRKIAAIKRWEAEKARPQP